VKNALLVLHGWTGSPSSWAKILAHLPDAAPVLRPALFGPAGERAPALTTFEREVGRRVAFLRAEGADDAPKAPERGPPRQHRHSHHAVPSRADDAPKAPERGPSP
jgi:hypothetical protein